MTESEGIFDIRLFLANQSKSNPSSDTHSFSQIKKIHMELE